MGALIWVMIIPMLVKIDFGALHQVKAHWKGIGVTVFVNWAVKPFSMALLGWLFIRELFAGVDCRPRSSTATSPGSSCWPPRACTAMVFVWSQLCRGNPYFTLSQVALNDALMIVLFAPIVALLLGISSITVPWDTLFVSVVLYVAIPVALSAAVAEVAAVAWPSGLRGHARAHRPLLDRGAAGHHRPAVRLPGRGRSCGSRW